MDLKNQSIALPPAQPTLGSLEPTPTSLDNGKIERKFSSSLIDMDADYCRICHCSESPSDGVIKLISPCCCSGSLKWVHHNCLQRWLDATNSQRCELCKFPFSMSIKYKPLHKWGALNASPSERRRLVCNSVFNLVSIICIFWSTYLLIERASLDAKGGNIDWSFYVKVSVVSIGLIIGVIFLFVQLKLYISIFMKWRKSNRIIIIRNANLTKKQNNTATSARSTTTNNTTSQVAPVTTTALDSPSNSTNTSIPIAATGNNQQSILASTIITVPDLKVKDSTGAVSDKTSIFNSSSHNNLLHSQKENFETTPLGENSLKQTTNLSSRDNNSTMIPVVDIVDRTVTQNRSLKEGVDENA